jgi:hypothetical protein
MKRKIVWWAISVLIAGSLGFLTGAHRQGIRNLALLSSARAQERLQVPSRAQICALGLLQGAYAFSAEGRAASGGDYAAEPYAAVGIANFDGQGKLTLSVTQSVGGTIYSSLLVAGTYALNESCGGRMTLSTGAIFDIVVSNTGREIDLIQVNVGNVIHGTIRRL